MFIFQPQVQRVNFIFQLHFFFHRNLFWFRVNLTVIMLCVRGSVEMIFCFWGQWQRRKWFQYLDQNLFSVYQQKKNKICLRMFNFKHFLVVVDWNSKGLISHLLELRIIYTKRIVKWCHMQCCLVAQQHPSLANWIGITDWRWWRWAPTTLIIPCSWIEMLCKCVNVWCKLAYNGTFEISHRLIRSRNYSSLKT